MKTKTFETSKGNILVVDLPEGLKDRKIVITKAGYPDIELIALGGTHPEYIGLLPSGDWQPLGLLRDIREEQAISVIEDRISIPRYDEFGYFDYKGSVPMILHDTAIESLTSLLETEISLSNPFGAKPAECGCMGPCGLPCEWDQWQSAEFRVWKNPFLMFKAK